MSWLDRALYPFQSGRIRPGIVQPGWMAMAGLFYALVTGGGFLYVVGFHAYALILAAAPLVLAVLWTTCVLIGYGWDVLSRILNTRPNQPVLVSDWTPWFRYGIEGAQLLTFYALLLGFFAAALYALDPLRELAPWLTLAFHPLLAAPILFSTRDRTFLGLLDACLDIPKLFKRNYVALWLSVTAYTLLFGGIVYPLIAAALLLSIVGWFCLPGLILAYFTGMFRLMAEHAQFSLKPVPVETPIYNIAEGIPQNPFAIAPPSPARPAPEFEAFQKAVAERPNPWRV